MFPGWLGLGRVYQDKPGAALSHGSLLQATMAEHIEIIILEWSHPGGHNWGRGVSVGAGVRVIVRVAVGRSVQVGRGVRVMVEVAVKVAVTAGVRVMVTVGGRRVEVGREREAGG